MHGATTGWRALEGVKEEVPAMVIVLATVGAALCCGLCWYGVCKAVHRSRERPASETEVITRRPSAG